MPLFMDIHSNVGDATPEDVANAHLADLDAQDKYGVKYLTYWFNHDAHKVFCLVEAPSKDAASAVHGEAHGLVADDLIEVESVALDAFMSIRQEDLPNAQRAADGSGALDPAVRAIMFTDLGDSTAMLDRLGDAEGIAQMRTHDRLIRESLGRHRGKQVKHTGDGIMAAFASAANSVACAVEIQRAFADHNAAHEVALRVRIGLSAGEPVEDSDDLFGCAVNLAARACAHAEPGQIVVVNVVRELCVGKRFAFHDIGDVMLKGFNDPVRLCEVVWQV